MAVSASSSRSSAGTLAGCSPIDLTAGAVLCPLSSQVCTKFGSEASLLGSAGGRFSAFQAEHRVWGKGLKGTPSCCQEELWCQ